ncbi:hypothetical protein, partial [Haemophilus parainfluenzae]|uniref:hypothetical protein n=1 Tax=Haemophilus parainfluenzae TaxID=729 RepID=UPI001788A359
PELAKRQTAFQIAHEQLNRALNVARSQNSEFRQSLANVVEAMEDYSQAAQALAEWMEQGKEQQS